MIVNVVLHHHLSPDGLEIWMTTVDCVLTDNRKAVERCLEISNKESSLGEIVTKKLDLILPHQR